MVVRLCRIKDRPFHCSLRRRPRCGEIDVSSVAQHQGSSRQAHPGSRCGINSHVGNLGDVARGYGSRLQGQSSRRLVSHKDSEIDNTQSSREELRGYDFQGDWLLDQLKRQGNFIPDRAVYPSISILHSRNDEKKERAVNENT
jgi:hypothetical protein